jgi:lysophospholipase L1-like esterase
MLRKLCAVVFWASAISGCGSDAGNNQQTLPLGTGGAYVGGATGSGGAGPVVPGAGGGVTTPGSGGAVSSTGGGMTVTPGSGGSVVMGAGGTMMVGAGGVSMSGGGAAGMAPSSGGADMGGMGGTSPGGAAGMAGMAGMGGMTNKPACLKNPGEVVFLGDSYVDYVVAHPNLETLVSNDAVKDGALMTGQAYRSYAVAGATMAAASLNMIPPQWPNAKTASADIKVVIMDGGGNDVLINNPQCKNPGSQNDATCKMVVTNTIQAVGNLIDDMKKTGVGDLIYFFYPHAPTGGADISDYALGILQNSAKLVTTADFRMYVVDLVPLFNGHSDYYYLDGIHANATGEQVIADAIYAVMKDHCIAQPASKGCCMP